MDVENALLCGKELSYEEIVSLREHLCRFSVKEIKFVLQRVNQFVSLARVKKLI